MRPAVTLLLAALTLTLLAPAAPSAPAGPAACLVQDGQGIAAVRLGIDEAKMLRLLGPPAGRTAGASGEVIYTFPGVVSQVTAISGVVRRLATRHPVCVTAKGVRVGDGEATVRAAYQQAPGSVRTQSDGVVRLLYPFDGVGFVLIGGAVALIEVFHAQPLSRAAARAPAGEATPAPPQAPAGVTLQEVTGRLEDSTFVVSGSVANSGAPIAVFVEIVLLGADGSRLAEVSAAVIPNPVGPGRTGSFQERVPVTTVVARFTVTVRTMNPPHRALAELTQQVGEVAQFAGMLDRLIDVAVLPPAAGRPGGSAVAVTNRSPLRITGLALELTLRGVCRNLVQPLAPLPTVPPQPAPTPTVVPFTVTRTEMVQLPVLGPGARVEVSIGTQGRGPCQGANTQWTVTWRVLAGSVQAAEGR
ncbi:MAG: hypothetical protein QN152_03590 [Armatimonadota bacterium]|nr:hypothetical protein [Armatimonadota bacterium]MDR7538596.1 hypothetical protein [Armatimonadota bacterium]